MISTNIMKFLKSLKFLFKPSYWIMVNTYSPEWDKVLNELMDKHSFILSTEVSAKIGGIRVWTGSHPYSSFTPYFFPSEPQPLPVVRPSRLTIERAHRKLMKDVFEVYIKKS